VVPSLTASDGLILSPPILEDGTLHNRMGGFDPPSFTGKGHRHSALPDRGPADGTTSYRDRYYLSTSR
jgi:hypothetical protein